MGRAGPAASSREGPGRSFNRGRMSLLPQDGEGWSSGFQPRRSPAKALIAAGCRSYPRMGRAGPVRLPAAKARRSKLQSRQDAAPTPGWGGLVPCGFQPRRPRSKLQSRQDAVPTPDGEAGPWKRLPAAKAPVEASIAAGCRSYAGWGGLVPCGFQPRKAPVEASIAAGCRSTPDGEDRRSGFQPRKAPVEASTAAGCRSTPDGEDRASGFQPRKAPGQKLQSRQDAAPTPMGRAGPWKRLPAAKGPRQKLQSRQDAAPT